MTVVKKLPLPSSGAPWIHAHYDLLLAQAVQDLNFSEDGSAQEKQIRFLDDGDSPVVLSVDTSHFAYVASQGKKGRDALKSFKDSLADSYLEPFEVLEVRRGHWVKLKAMYSNIIFQINSEESTDQLEPMEWIIGRIVRFEKNPYLMENWFKVSFKNRKALKTYLTEQLGEVQNDAAWFTTNKMWLKKNASALIQKIESFNH
jgi:hypothetical protein